MQEPTEISQAYLDKVAGEDLDTSDAYKEAALEAVSQETGNLESSDGGAVGETPSIQDILETWNARFPEDERILGLSDLAELVNRKDLDDETFVLVQTLLAFLVDAQTQQAGLNVISEVAQALLARNAKKAGKGLRSQAKAKAINDDAKSARVALLGLTVDIQTNVVDPIGLLRDLQHEAYDVKDFADDLITSDAIIASEYGQ